MYFNFSNKIVVGTQYHTHQYKITPMKMAPNKIAPNKMAPTKTCVNNKVTEEVALPKVVHGRHAHGAVVGVLHLGR